MEIKHFGARLQNDGICSFRIFAPHCQDVKINIENDTQRVESLIPAGRGFYEATLDEIAADSLYSFILDDSNAIPDPASLWQPAGRNTASVIIDHHNFDWKEDRFSGLPMHEMLIYEAHVGTFSPENNFSGIISKLPYLKDLGINTLQLMPVAQFSGSIGWGYETTFPYAVHSPYGTPNDLKNLVRLCHRNEIAVILDVSFSKLIPVQDLAPAYMPFFSEKYNLRQGMALNFDEKYSYGVREFYIQCALSWLRDYRVDGLRIKDADTIFDQTPVHFLEELSTRIKEFADAQNRTCVLITGDKRSAMRPVLPPEKGGYGMDALYNDDFYCALRHATGETCSHINDAPEAGRLVSAMQYGFAYRGEISEQHLRLHGRRKSELRGCKFVVYSQGHELESDRNCECRVIERSGFEAAKLSAGATILSPFVPMIFMGEEYGETAPFNFFSDYETNNEDQNSHCAASSEAAFEDCRLNWSNIDDKQGKAMLDLYRRLLKIRKEHPTIHEPCRSRCQVQEIAPGIVLVFRNPTSADRRYAAALYNFNKNPARCRLNEYLPEGIWTTELYSASPKFSGTAKPLPGILQLKEAISMAGHSFALFLYSRIKI